MNTKVNRTEPAGGKTHKPFLKGSVFDENTFRHSLAIFGVMIVVFFVAFIACASASFSNTVLRLIMNLAVISVALMVFYNNGAGRGTEAVTRGEILYQRKEKGHTVSESELRACYHPLKGFATGLLGTLPFLITAIILALNATIQMTQAGALPSWMQTYTGRADIGNALINYTQPEKMSLVDYSRTIVRICLLPFVNIVSYSNKSGMLLLERISPILILFPSVSYGIGYLTGKKIRTKIHTVISESDRKRIRKENRRRRTVRNGQTRRDEQKQLN